jgi:hypothetical protein
MVSREEIEPITPRRGSSIEENSLDIPKIVSVDDHVVEPPDLWTSRLPKRYVDTGPRILRKRGFAEPFWSPSDDGEWADIWYYEDLMMPFQRMSAAVGLGERRWGTVTFEELHPGSWQQKERLEAMDENHVEVSLCFPNVLPRFCGQTFAEAADKELALLCVRAYNDWIIDEWCAGEGRGRLIPLTIVPLWDVRLAVEELRRCAGKGSHAVTFPEDPSALGENTVHSMLDFVFSATLARFPNLRVAYAEGQIGWLPFVIERADRIWMERSDNSFGRNGIRLDEPPSHYVRRQVFGCIFDDEAGLDNRYRIGMSQICFEVDYPHSDSTFPHTKKVLTSMCTATGLNQDETYALVRGNAISLFGLNRFGIHN